MTGQMGIIEAERKVKRMLQGQGILAEEMAASPILFGYVLLILFILGTVMGSFLTCYAGRFIARESVLKGRSHCDACGHVLGAGDLIPVVSYLALKGRCRYCGSRISPRCVVTELLMGALFDAGLLRYGLCFSLLCYLVLVCILLALSLIDLDTCLIPDRFHLAAIVNRAAFLPLIVWEQSGKTGFRAALLSASAKSLLTGAVTAAVMLLASLLFDRITGKESMGGGDIKLYFVAGLYLAGWSAYLCVILSCIIGLLTAACMKKHKIPFGPSIAAALVLCLLFGDDVIRWYLGLF